MGAAKIVIVCDAEGVSELEACVAGLGYAVCGAVSSAEMASAAVTATSPALLLIDLGFEAGVAVAEQFQERPDLPAVYLTGDVDEGVLRRLRQPNAYGCVLKPYDARQLWLSIDGALSAHDRQRRAATARPEDAAAEAAGAGPRLDAEFFTAALDALHDGVMLADPDGRFLFVNQTSMNAFGPRQLHASPDRWSETYGVFESDGRTPLQPENMPLLKAAAGADIDSVQHVVRHPDRAGDIVVDVQARPIRDARGRLLGGIALSRDVTARRALERRLDETLETLRAHSELRDSVFNGMREAMVVVNAAGEVLMANPAARRIARIDSDDQIAERLATAFYEPDGKTPVPLEECPLARALRGETFDGVRLLMRLPQQPDIRISVSGWPLLASSGAVRGGITVFGDVTKEEKRNQDLLELAERLRDQKQTMEAVFNSISDGVVVIDEQGRLAMYNPSAERILGVGRHHSHISEWRRTAKFFHTDKVTPFPPEEYPLARALRDEDTDDLDVFMRHPAFPDGAYINFSSRPLREDDGSLSGGVAVFRDVTERMLANEAVSRAFAQGRLEVVDTLLHNVGNAINSVGIGVATMHDRVSRNEPLRRLTLVAEAIAAHDDDRIAWLESDPQGRQALPFLLTIVDDLKEEQARLMLTIERVRGRVEHIVGILRTQRSLGGAAQVGKDIRLESAIEEALKIQQDSIARRGIRVEVDCARAPDEIRIQESQFHQMIVNLVKNSIEAIDELVSRGQPGAEPRIRIEAYVRQSHLVLDVTDNGIGIAPEHMERMFSAGFSTKRGGSGIGLHSIANFVRETGGSIEPLSEGIGRGATIRVMLALAPAGQPAASARTGAT